MGRKREARILASRWPEVLEVPASIFDPLVQEQATGSSWYGSCIYPPAARKAKRLPNAVSVHSHLQHARSVLPVRHLDPAVFVPPAGLARQAPEARATALPAPPEFSLPPLPPQTDWQQVLGLSDEDGLIIEARLLGKPWAEVATFTPGRTQAVLKKHYNSVLRPLMEAVLQAQPHALLPHPQFQQGGQPPPRAAHLSNPLHPAPSAAQAPSAAGSQAAPGPIKVNRRCGDPVNGEARVRLSQRLPPPAGTTVQQAHGLPSLQGVAFFAEVVVTDSDDLDKAYHFILADASHGACFNIGLSAAGAILISWSQLHSLYQLPDGSKWAEATNLIDREDLEEHARKEGKAADALIAGATHQQELFRRAGRYHARLQNVEYECWLFKAAVPPDFHDPSNAYFWRTTFDPATLQPCM